MNTMSFYVLPSKRRGSKFALQYFCRKRHKSHAHLHLHYAPRNKCKTFRPAIDSARALQALVLQQYPDARTNGIQYIFEKTKLTSTDTPPHQRSPAWRERQCGRQGAAGHPHVATLEPDRRPGDTGRGSHIFVVTFLFRERAGRHFGCHF